MAQSNNSNAEEHFIRIVKATQALSTVNNIGTHAKETLFYGKINITTHLKPRIIEHVGKCSKLSTSTVEYFNMLQEDLFGFVPVENVIKFRDQNKQPIKLPQSILKSMDQYKNTPYYVVAINVFNQYQKYAKKQFSDKSIGSMSFLNQILFKIERDHYVTIYGTVAKYHLGENKLTGEYDLLAKILKRTATEIQDEMLHHKHFDENQLTNRQKYVNAHKYNEMNINFLSFINEIEKPHLKPGQMYESDFSGGDAIFYISLFEEDPNNRMAQKWLMEHGFFAVSMQRRLLLIFGEQNPMDLSLCW